MTQTTLSVQRWKYTDSRSEQQYSSHVASLHLLSINTIMFLLFEPISVPMFNSVYRAWEPGATWFLASRVRYIRSSSSRPLYRRGTATSVGNVSINRIRGTSHFLHFSNVLGPYRALFVLL